MIRDAFLRKLRRYARKAGTEIMIEAARGKGGHCIVRLGSRWTTVQSGELSPFHVRRCCEQLGIGTRDL